ncbi:putative short chain oxidoreductase/dehydrogenase [Xylariaceae sp. AK1471]|nr:putative short chain oxidoreductase/dehydrogenase [Xylariaceae sp. AK1471]
MAQPQVWLITGASRGLGFDMAKTALKAGHKVLSCYRNKPDETTKWDELEALGGIWTQLDVCSEDTESKVKALVAEHGKIDVLVNNAGYGLLGTIEDTPVDKVQAIFNTNFIGTLRTVKGVLPSMRERKTGTIVNISSSSATSPLPGLGIYAATKCAMEGYSEVLEIEVAAFGIRVLLVAPGATATEFASETGTGIRVPLSEPYQEAGPVKQVSDYLSSRDVSAVGAPSIAVAERIVEAVDGTGFMAGKEVGLRLPLGKDTGEGIEKRAALFTDLATLKDVWNSV